MKKKPGIYTPEKPRKLNCRQAKKRPANQDVILLICLVSARVHWRWNAPKKRNLQAR